MRFLGFFIALLLSISLVSAIDLDDKNRDTAYVKTILDRSEKNVKQLKLKDSVVATEVRNIIANRYFRLNDIYAKRDSILLSVKGNSLLSKDEKDKLIQAAQNEKDAALYKSHFAFPADLSLCLNEKQIEAVKDGMTFGVVKVTYDATVDMIPTLTKEEKKQILAWLTEARELALDAETSNKKHEVFGKYKGRINNYLSKRGYNLVKEREAWYKRIEVRKKKSVKAN
jgi:ribonuclease HII